MSEEMVRLPSPLDRVNLHYQILQVMKILRPSLDVEFANIEDYAGYYHDLAGALNGSNLATRLGIRKIEVERDDEWGPKPAGYLGQIQIYASLATPGTLAHSTTTLSFRLTLTREGDREVREFSSPDLPLDSGEAKGSE